MTRGLDLRYCGIRRHSRVGSRGSCVCSGSIDSDEVVVEWDEGVRHDLPGEVDEVKGECGIIVERWVGEGGVVEELPGGGDDGGVVV